MCIRDSHIGAFSIKDLERLADNGSIDINGISVTPTQISVSYTHLDVYKRQVPDIARRRTLEG